MNTEFSQNNETPIPMSVVARVSLELGMAILKSQVDFHAVKKSYGSGNTDTKIASLIKSNIFH